jgi:hypothetical protein
MKFYNIILFSNLFRPKTTLRQPKNIAQKHLDNLCYPSLKRSLFDNYHVDNQRECESKMVVSNGKVATKNLAMKNVVTKKLVIEI